MSQKFNTGIRFNHNFGTLEVWSFIGEGVGAVLYIAGVLTDRVLPEALGVALLVLAIGVLRAHLGQPTRGWRALTKVANAWVSRGTLVIATFTGLAAASVAARYLSFLQPFGEQAPGLAHGESRAIVGDADPL